MKKIISFIIYVSLFLMSVVFIVDDVSSLLSKKDYITIGGIINTWAIWGIFFLSIYALILTLFNRINNNTERIILAIALIISPIASLIYRFSTENLYKDYVECNELRETSSRYSSRTYAISPEVCSLLKNKRL